MDYFTKWPEAYTLPDQGAETIAEALVGGSQFGAADQGRHFESRVDWALQGPGEDGGGSVQGPATTSGRRVALHRDRLGPYRGNATPQPGYGHSQTCP